MKLPLSWLREFVNVEAEALEIARKFSSPESVQFINGVLYSVGRELDAVPSPGAASGTD